MSKSHYLKPLEHKHHELVKNVYINAIQEIGPLSYSDQQIVAWSSLAFLPGVLDESLSKGKGFVSFEEKEIAAFAVRYPLNRLALLYCRASFSRRGHATRLLNYIEFKAREEGKKFLYTEASIFSHPLLIKLGWNFIRYEFIEIGGVKFKRYRMKKELRILSINTSQGS